MEIDSEVSDIFAASNDSDPIFRNVRDGLAYKQEREWLGRLWARYEPFADKQFKQEIGHHFRERFWEMSLACALLDQEFDLVPRQSRPSEGPDLCIRTPNGRIWVEAVAPGPGKGADAVGFRDGESFPPESDIVLRYCSAIRDKYKKLKDYLKKGIVGESEPFIIAISGSNIDRADYEKSVLWIIRAVLAVGPLGITIDQNSGEVLRQGYAYRPAVTKRSGCDVPTTLFLDPKFGSVSALIAGCPRATDLAAPPLTLLHNPYAGNPLPFGWLRHGEEYWVEHEQLHRGTHADSSQILGAG